MNLNKKLENMKEMHKNILDFIEIEENADENFRNLQKIFDEQKIKNNKYDLISLFRIICKITDNHHRGPLFFDKIDKILMFFKEDIKKIFTNSEIFNLFKNNKRILLFLIEEGIMIIDEYIAKTITNEKYMEMSYPQYFSPEIKPFMTSKWFLKNNLCVELIKKELPDNFNELRKIGENDKFIYDLIRKDLVEDFIIYMNKTNISLKSSIKQSIYETNAFLIKEEQILSRNNRSMKLIEYAAFFGSIQIFQYLKLNNVELTSSLWLYAIHGNHPEIINILEENDVKPNDETYVECYIESIKCHHNNVANYIHNNYLKYKDQMRICINELIFKYHNISFKDINLISQLSFNYSCKYDYPSFIVDYFALKDIDVNGKFYFNSI